MSNSIAKRSITLEAADKGFLNGLDAGMTRTVFIPAVVHQTRRLGSISLKPIATACRDLRIVRTPVSTN